DEAGNQSRGVKYISLDPQGRFFVVLRTDGVIELKRWGPRDIGSAGQGRVLSATTPFEQPCSTESFPFLAKPSPGPCRINHIVHAVFDPSGETLSVVFRKFQRRQQNSNIEYEVGVYKIDYATATRDPALEHIRSFAIRAAGEISCVATLIYRNEHTQTRYLQMAISSPNLANPNRSKILLNNVCLDSTWGRPKEKKVPVDFTVSALAFERFYGHFAIGDANGHVHVSPPSLCRPVSFSSSDFRRIKNLRSCCDAATANVLFRKSTVTSLAFQSELSLVIAYHDGALRVLEHSKGLSQARALSISDALPKGLFLGGAQSLAFDSGTGHVYAACGGIHVGAKGTETIHKNAWVIAPYALQ
ncbi:MAG: hypothetical protein AAF550_11225, partial [Myxococcota bacterium]